MEKYTFNIEISFGNPIIETVDYFAESEEEAREYAQNLCEDPEDWLGDIADRAVEINYKVVE